MKVLVTGKDGLLAPYFKKLLPIDWEVHLTGRRNGILKADLSLLKDVKDLLNKVNPDIIIHCAAMTDVDFAEKNQELAYKTNCELIKNLIKYIKNETLFIYFSSDQVYPGIKNFKELYKEGDENPINVYGKTKLEGEKVLLAHKKSIIFRSNFFGKSFTKNRYSFDEFILNTVNLNKKLYLYDDILFSPLSMKSVVNITKLSIQQNLIGVYNLGSNSGMSKYQFGKQFLKKMKIEYSNIVKSNSSDKKNRAPRPLNMQMNSNKIEKKLKIKLPKLIDEINNYVR